MQMLLDFTRLFIVDALFVIVFLACLIPLALYSRAAFAVLRRNFIGYFSNPTGYVFICLFVLLTSFAAFWPHEFFTANLANLDQLNRYLPYIMLIFIPAITMSIWADERRQGTDELLLTLPAGDFDIVIGKYLAAAAIFTTSLMFSQISNYLVLISLTWGNVDTGLFCTTYLGYWLIGLAMLSIGMVASFLTSNLTVGFILGAAFNAPLAFASSADVIIPSDTLSRLISQWSLAAQFDSFGRGVISLSSTIYFLAVIAVGLYLSMVLIGSRHWSGGRDGHSMFGHFLVRTLALIVIALSANAILFNHDVRADMTEGKVSSLSPDSLRLIRELESEYPIYIDAFISAEVPEEYITTKYNLISMLKEFEAKAGSDIRVNMYDDLETFSEDAKLAQERFGIEAQQVRTRSRGKIVDDEIILGAAFTCGLQKVVVPFFDYGIPVEYELVRSIATVARTERKKLGVVRTDAQLFGGFSFAGGMPQQIPKQEIVIELEKQYDVEEVDLLEPLEVGKFDVLMVVQPSSLPPESLENLIQVIQQGQPTAIFEDPFPYFMRNVPGTGQPKQSPGGMMGMGQRPMPKGDIRRLWAAIGVDSTGSINRQGLFEPDIVWQNYNPYPKLQVGGIPDEWVFVREEAPEADGAISDHDVTRGLDEIFFPFPGMIEPADSDATFTKLLTTGELAGTIAFTDLTENQQDPQLLQALRRRRGRQIVAAEVKGEVELLPAPSADPNAPKPEGKGNVNVIYVADIDLMIPAFLRIRARPDEQEDIQWNFENVTFLLNVIDALSGDTDYVEIRKRQPRHATLRVVEERIQGARDLEFTKGVEFQNKYQEAISLAEKEKDKALERFDEAVNDLRKQQREGKGDPVRLRNELQKLAEKQAAVERNLEIKKQRFQREREAQVKQIRRDVDLQIETIKNGYKFWAVALPWIPPFLVGIVVFVQRRLREREGISKSRLR